MQTFIKLALNGRNTLSFYNALLYVVLLFHFLLFWTAFCFVCVLSFCFLFLLGATQYIHFDVIHRTQVLATAVRGRVGSGSGRNADLHYLVNITVGSSLWQEIGLILKRIGVLRFRNIQGHIRVTTYQDDMYLWQLWGILLLVYLLYSRCHDPPDDF